MNNLDKHKIIMKIFKNKGYSRQKTKLSKNLNYRTININTNYKIKNHNKKQSNINKKNNINNKYKR